MTSTPTTTTTPTTTQTSTPTTSPREPCTCETCVEFNTTCIDESITDGEFELANAPAQTVWNTAAGTPTHLVLPSPGFAELVLGAAWTPAPVLYSNAHRFKGVGPAFKDGTYLDGCTTDADCLLGSFCHTECTGGSSETCGRYLNTNPGARGRFCAPNEEGTRGLTSNSKFSVGIVKHNEHTVMKPADLPARQAKLATQSLFIKSGRMLHASGMNWNLLKDSTKPFEKWTWSLTVTVASHIDHVNINNRQVLAFGGFRVGLYLHDAALNFVYPLAERTEAAGGQWAVDNVIELEGGGVDVTVKYTVCAADVAVFEEYERINGLDFSDDVMVMLEANNDEQTMTVFDNVHVCYETADWTPRYPICSPGTLDYIMVIDRSYSINGDLEKQKQNAQNHADALVRKAWAKSPTRYHTGVHTSLAVWMFDRGMPLALYKLARINPGDNGQLAAIITAIGNLVYAQDTLNKGTTIGESLSVLMSMYVSANPSPNAFKMMLFSDSDPDEVTEPDPQFKANIAAFRQSLNALLADSKCLHYSTTGVQATDTGRLEQFVGTEGAACIGAPGSNVPRANPTAQQLAAASVADALRYSACINHPDHCFCGSHLTHWKKKHFTQSDYEERCHNCTTATTTQTTTPTTTQTTTATTTLTTTPSTTATTTPTTTPGESRCPCDACVDCDGEERCGCVETFDTAPQLKETEMFRPESNASHTLAQHDCNVHERWSYRGKKLREVGVHQYTRTSVMTKNSKVIHFQDQCLYVLAGSVFHDTGVTTTYNHNFDINFDVVLLEGHQFPSMEVKVWYGPSANATSGTLLGEALYTTEDDLYSGTPGSAGTPEVKKVSLTVSVGNVSATRDTACTLAGTAPSTSLRACILAHLSAASALPCLWWC